MVFKADLKRGSMELLILSVLENRARHGYDIGKSLERCSDGKLEFRVSTLYSVLYRMEERGWIKGRWLEKTGKRRRCSYSLTAKGRRVLREQKAEWRSFVDTVDLIVGGEHG